jgi:hypothetical protein
MQLGVALPQRGKDASVENIALVAREAEAIGLDSVWVTDRLLRPLRPVQLLPGVDAQPLPDYYANVFDPIETLTYVAALTERVRLGTSAINALFHPPLVLVRRLATLDQVSGGRVIAGIVQGWLACEFVVAGVPRTRRGAGMAEHVAAMRAVWAQDPVRFQGRFCQIPASETGPKPLQSASAAVPPTGSIFREVILRRSRAASAEVPVGGMSGSLHGRAVSGNKSKATGRPRQGLRPRGRIPRSRWGAQPHRMLRWSIGCGTGWSIKGALGPTAIGQNGRHDLRGVSILQCDARLLLRAA